MVVLLLVVGVVLGGALGAVLGANRARAKATARAAARLGEVVDGVRSVTGALESGGGEVEPPASRRSDPEHVASLVEAVTQLQRAGLRAVGEQRAIGTGYSDVSVSLARRSETLVQRQLNLIEQMELDPANKHLLDDLFRLDHLVTRMRRINTNTMVLSRVSVSRTYSAPLELSDVLFGALAGIEQYQRVTVSTDLTRHVRGSVAGDLMGLLTELVDNAAAFSPPATPVVVTAVEDAGGDVVVRVTDRGLGIPAEDLDKINARMRSAVVDDLSAVRRVGLMVVARLATRHGLEVVLQNREEGTGTLAKVVVPAKHLVTSAATVTNRPPSASTEVFRERGAAGSTPARTLAPSGRNETAPVPVGTRDPEPVDLPTRVPGASPLSGAQEPGRHQNPEGLPVREPAAQLPVRSPATGGSGWFAPAENSDSPAQPSSDPPPTRRRPAGATAHIGDSTTTVAGRYRSRWFSRPGDGAPEETGGSVAVAVSTEQDEWSSTADEGWRVVDPSTESAPLVDSTSGLPVRQAGANLFPGSASGAAAGAAPVAHEVEAAATRQPFVVRSRLGSYRRGVQQARGAASRPSAGSAWTVMHTSSTADAPADGSPQEQSSFPTAVRTGT